MTRPMFGEIQAGQVGADLPCGSTTALSIDGIVIILLVLMHNLCADQDMQPVRRLLPGNPVHGCWLPQLVHGY